MKIGIMIPSLIVNDKHRWLLYNLLDSIEKHEPDLISSTVVCDDASPCSDAEMRTLLSPYPVTLLRRPKNESYSKNVNMGLRFMREKGINLVFIINNDITLIQPILPLVRYFEKMERLAIVGPRLFFPDGRLQHGGLEVHASKAIEHPGYGKWDLGIGTRFVTAVTGAFQLVRLDKVDAYPEEYSLGYEDVSFCLRTWIRGGQVLYSDSISAIHAESSTRGYFVGPKEWESLSAFRREQFDFPVKDAQLEQSRQSMPLSRLQKLCPPQPFLQYQRDPRNDHLSNSLHQKERKAEWGLARKHLGLEPVGPPKSCTSPHHASPCSDETHKQSKRLPRGQKSPSNHKGDKG